MRSEKGEHKVNIETFSFDNCYFFCNFFRAAHEGFSHSSFPYLILKDSWIHNISNRVQHMSRYPIDKGHSTVGRWLCRQKGLLAANLSPPPQYQQSRWTHSQYPIDIGHSTVGRWLCRQKDFLTANFFEKSNFAFPPPPMFSPCVIWKFSIEKSPKSRKAKKPLNSI